MGFEEVYQLPLAGSLGTKSELNFWGDIRVCYHLQELFAFFLSKSHSSVNREMASVFFSSY